MSDDTRAWALPVVGVSVVVVLAIGVWESVNGVAPVAGTASSAALVLVPLSLAAIVVKVMAGRSPSPRAPWSLTVIALLSAALVVVVLVAAYRAHTASGRFADDVAALPLPTRYESVPVDPADTLHDKEPEHTARAWRVPSGTDPCPEIERAFKKWTDEPAEAFSRGDSCAAVANDGTEKAEISVSADGSTVTLEMWLEGSTLIHF